MVADGGDGVPQLLRHSRQLSQSANVCPRNPAELAALAAAAWRLPEALVATLCTDSRKLASPASDPPSLSQPALFGEVLDVGAVCVNCARTDLCGGLPARAVPTATPELAIHWSSARSYAA